MYLMDSILKNVGGVYVEIFGTHIVDVFIRTFRFAEPAIQQKLLGLLHTWKMSSLFKKDILDEIDMKVEAIKADIKRRQKEWVTPSTNVAPVSTGPILSSTPTMPPTSMTSAPVQSMPTQPQRNNNMIPNYTGPTYPYPNPMVCFRSCVSFFISFVLLLLAHRKLYHGHYMRFIGLDKT